MNRPDDWPTYLAKALPRQQWIDHEFCPHPRVDMNLCVDGCAKSATERLRIYWRTDMNRWLEQQDWMRERAADKLAEAFAEFSEAYGLAND